MNFSMSIDRPRDGSAVVRVGGEVDLATAPELRRCLLDLRESGHHDLVVDLAEARFLDSTGIAVLVDALKRSRQVGGTFRVGSASPHVRQVLDLTGVSPILGLC